MMDLKNYYIKIKQRFKELLKFKIVRYTLLIQGFYFILSLILTLIFFRDQNDFLVYYEGAKAITNNLSDLYNPLHYTRFPFRYFPISAFFFVPFYLIGFDLGFILFNLINLILNILICIFLYKIIILVRAEDHEKKDERIIVYISVFLMGLPNLFNYILGQINLYITFLILTSLFLFLKYEDYKHNFLASIILGISIIFKPITVLLIPFLFMIKFDLERKKFEIKFLKSIIRLIGFLIPVSLNFIMFFIYPELYEGFLTVNFTGDDAVIVNHSFSITKLFQNFFFVINLSHSQILLLIIILIIVGGIGFIIYLIRRISNFSLIYGYTLGILIMLLVYFDSWDHHLLNLTPLLITVLFNLPRKSMITKKFIKPTFFFLSFFDLACMGIFVLLIDVFPFNFVPTIFLLLCFYGICKICLKKESK